MMRRFCWLFVIPVMALAPARGLGQLADADGELARLLDQPRVAGALARLNAGRAATAELLARVGAIVSPSGQEHERARVVAARMRAIGLDAVEVTDTPNAIGIVRGRSERVVVFVSTLDDPAIVAEHQRTAEAPPRVDGDRVVGPGTNTSVTTVGMLAAAEAYVASGLQPEHTVVFAAVAQEDTGLVGMKALYERYGGRAIAFVDVFGDGHSISYGALGIHWWRVVARGPAGHTLGGGVPNVNQAIGRAVDRILSLPDAGRTDDSRTRVNIAMLDSGTVFNHKPESGWFSLDIRSIDMATIARIEREVEAILEVVSTETDIELTMEPFQLTIGGQISGAVRSRPVQVAAAISRWLGYDPTLTNSGSSNLNIAIGAGTAAIAISGSRGGDRGRPSEWADINGLMRTARHVLMLAIVLGGDRGSVGEQ